MDKEPGRQLSMTTAAIAARNRRARESAEKREARLAAGQARRANESKEQRQKRLAANKQRRRQQRQNEDDEQHQKINWKASSESFSDMGINLCMVQNCYNNRLSCPDLAFFKLPKDPVRARKWVELAMREDLLQNDIFLKRDCRMCSAHFTDIQFRKKYPRILLNQDALPVNLIKVTPSKKTTENYTDTSRTLIINEEINGCITVPLKQETAEKSPEETSENYFDTNKIVMMNEERNGYAAVPIKQETADESDNQSVVLLEETIDIIKTEIKEESIDDITVTIRQETADTLHDQSFVRPEETFANYTGSNTTMIKSKEKNGFMTVALKNETDEELDNQPVQENEIIPGVSSQT